MLNDIRLAIRSIGRAPGFAIATVGTLALGIGANTAVFSVVNAVLLRPMPQVEDPARLVRIYTNDSSGPRYGTSSYPDYVDFRDRATTLSGLAAFDPESLQLSAGEVGEIAPGEAVSGNYFSVLGVAPALGRLLVPDDDDPAGHPFVAVISHALWQRSFGGDRSVLGGFSLVALLMAMVGLAGLLAHSVAARTRELGIRMAVGARGVDLVHMIVRRGLGLVGAGALLGSAVSMVTGRLLDRFLFGISGADAVTMVTAVLILTAAGAAATYLPARQATKVDPVTALRTE